MAVHATATATIAVEPPLEPITIGMFQAMIRAGIVREADPVFLWDGRLARRMAPNRPHSIAVKRAYDALIALLPAGVFVESEQPMALRHSHSAPQPDLKVVRGLPEDFPADYPTTADVPLVVEVADSSLADDRVLMATYAREGVPVAWIINVPDHRIEVFDDPGPISYRNRLVLGPDEPLPVVLDGVEVSRVRAGDLLPPGPGR